MLIITLFASLASFKERIDQEAHLQIMVGEPLDLFSRLKRKLPDWQAIYFNEDTCGFERGPASYALLKKIIFSLSPLWQRN